MSRRAWRRTTALILGWASLVTVFYAGLLPAPALDDIVWVVAGFGLTPFWIVVAAGELAVAIGVTRRHHWARILVLYGMAAMCALPFVLRAAFCPARCLAPTRWALAGGTVNSRSHTLPCAHQVGDGCAAGAHRPMSVPAAASCGGEGPLDGRMSGRTLTQDPHPHPHLRIPARAATFHSE